MSDDGYEPNMERLAAKKVQGNWREEKIISMTVFPSGSRAGKKNWTSAISGNTETTNWRHFVDVMESESKGGNARVKEKHDALLWTPWSFSDGLGSRTADNAHCLTMIGLDFDGVRNGGVNDIVADLTIAGLASLTHSTFSHQFPKDANRDRFRVFLPLTRPIKKSEWTQEVKGWIAEAFVGMDGSCLDVARQFYMPSTDMVYNLDPLLCETKGCPVDVDSLLDMAASYKASRAEYAYAQEGRTIRKASDPELPTELLSFKAWDAFRWFKETGRYLRLASKGGWHEVVCPEIEKHSSGDGGAYIRIEDDSRLWSFKCHHNHNGVTHDGPWLSKWLGNNLTPEEESKYLLRVGVKVQDIESAFRGEVIKCDRRYLQLVGRIDDPIFNISCPLEEAEDIAGKGNHLTVYLKSPKGTGKTKALESFVRGRRSVLCISHRIALAGELARRLGLANYQDSVSSDSLSICVNSLYRLLDDKRRLRAFDVVVIDEVEQVLAALTGPTLKDQRGLVYSLLEELIRRAKIVVCSDADLTMELTVKFVSPLRTGSKEVLIKNVVQSNEHYKFYRSRNDILNQFLLSCESPDGPRSYLATNKKGGIAEAITEVARGRGVKLLLVTSDTVNKGDKDVRMFLDSPAKFLQGSDYRGVVATGVISTGFNIDEKGLFEGVYGVFDPGIYTAFDCDQAIFRVRHSECRHLWVHPGYGLSPDVIAGRQIHEYRALQSISRLAFRAPDPFGCYGEGQVEERYLELFDSVLMHSNVYSNARDRWLKHMYGDAGAVVEQVEEDVSSTRQVEELKDDLKLARQVIKGKHIDELQEARCLTGLEFEDLEKKSDLTGEEVLAREKYLLALSLNKSPDELSRKEIERGWDGVEVYRSIRDMRRSPEENEEKDYDEARRGVLPPDRRYRLARQRIWMRVEELTGLGLEDLPRQLKQQAVLEREMQQIKSSCTARRQRDILLKPVKREYEGARAVIRKADAENVTEFLCGELDIIGGSFGINFKRQKDGSLTPQQKGKLMQKLFDRHGVKLERKKSGDYVVKVDETLETLCRDGE